MKLSTDASLPAKYLEDQQPLPVGVTEFHEWAKRITDLVGPLADIDSMNYVLASAILSAPPDASELPDNYFTSRLKKAAANQVASYIFQDIKAKQAAKSAEATASTQENAAADATEKSTN